MKLMQKSKKKRGRPRCFDKDVALDAALGVFHERGYEGCSIDDITAALKINRPSLYSAFGNKEQLFIEVLKKYHGNYRDFFKSLIAEELPPKKTIEKWLSFFLENSRAQKDPLGCLIVNSTLLAGSNYPRISSELKKFHDQNEKLLTGYLAAEKKSGRFSGDPAATSQFYNAVVQGMAVLHRSQRDQNALENIASNALKAWPG